MLKDKERETIESGKMLALTLCLTNFLLLAVCGGVFWLVQILLNENGNLSELSRGIVLR